MYLY
jgi:hypothetical protein